jgi:hypothetical protein
MDKEVQNIQQEEEEKEKTSEQSILTMKQTLIKDG